MRAHGRNANMTENNAIIHRPHDWVEAEKMVSVLSSGGNPSFHQQLAFAYRLASSIHSMEKRNEPFDDDSFREMLEYAIAHTVLMPCYYDSLTKGIISRTLSEDVNAHPIDCFQELLSCMHMHRVGGEGAASYMGIIWHAHELMKRNGITEYNDNETETPLVYILGYDAFISDDAIIMRTGLLDIIMRTWGNDIGLRRRMVMLAFAPASLPNNTAATLTATRSYFANEPDYQAALSIFDDFITEIKMKKINAPVFRDILKSCDANPNAMSGFIHAVIELFKATDCEAGRLACPRFFSFHDHYDGSLYSNPFIYSNPNMMRLTLTNLAEGYPVEYITELIISEIGSMQG